MNIMNFDNILKQVIYRNRFVIYLRSLKTLKYKIKSLCRKYNIILWRNFREEYLEYFDNNLL